MVSVPEVGQTDKLTRMNVAVAQPGREDSYSVVLVRSSLKTGLSVARKLRKKFQQGEVGRSYHLADMTWRLRWYRHHCFSEAHGGLSWPGRLDHKLRLKQQGNRLSARERRHVSS